MDAKNFDEQEIDQEEISPENLTETNKEIVKEINLEANQLEANQLENKQEDKQEISVENSSKFVEKKPITKLKEEEKALIIKNYLDGIDQPFFEVKQFKNGNYKIIKKKQQKQTITDKALNSEKPPTNSNKNQKVFYSDNQLLFEHIIDLNSKFDKLMNKHKKLKRKYQNLQQDIYADSEDLDDEIPQLQNSKILQNGECQIEEKIEKLEKLEKSVEEPTNQTNQKIQTNQGIQKGWRSRLNYL